MNRSHFCFNQNKFSEMQLGGLRKNRLQIHCLDCCGVL